MPTDSFYRNAQMADGFLNRCKECVSLQTRSYRQANITQCREHDRTRSKHPYRKTFRKPRAEIKDKANKTAQKAVANGDIPRLPCYFCRTGEAEMHHPDYRRPLLVYWLCRACHSKMHAILKATNLEAEKMR